MTITIEDDHLCAFMRTQNVYETPEENLKREQAIATLNTWVQQWMREECARQNRVVSATAEPALLHTFGSFRLGVSGPAADIDTLVIGPRFIERQTFLTEFAEVLRQHPDQVRELVCRFEAYVPLMTFYFDDIEMDVLYTRATVDDVRSNSFDITSDIVLRGMDEKSMLSLNGIRGTDRLLQEVPHPDIFRTALRFVKLWAKRRGIYSNVMGYLGGISWAILTAHICQLFPTLSACDTIRAFFRVYSMWRYPNPVMLNEPYDLSVGLDVWSLSDYRNKRHVMPILTPSYPSLNSSHNVSESTLHVMRSEFLRATDVFASYELTCKQDTEAKKMFPWDELAQPVDFFLLYKTFIEVKVMAACEKDQLAWLGYVESKIRHVFAQWHQLEGARIRPFPKSFQRPGGSDGPHETHFYIGIEVDASRLKQAKERGRQFTLQLSDGIQYLRGIIDRYMPPDTRPVGMEMAIQDVSCRDLPVFVFPDARRPTGYGRKKRTHTDSTTHAAKRTKQSTQQMPAPAILDLPQEIPAHFLPPTYRPPAFVAVAATATATAHQVSRMSELAQSFTLPQAYRTRHIHASVPSPVQVHTPIAFSHSSCTVRIQ